MVEGKEPSTDATTATPNYYAKGNVEKQIETPVMRKRLEKVCGYFVFALF